MIDFAPVGELLRRRIGLDPHSTGPGLVVRAARSRMNALGLAETEVDRYQEIASQSEQEFQSLVEAVVVPESWFFRDETPFELLAQRAVSGWLVDPAREPLRALSVPCAGGEEPYSIALALMDRGLSPKRFHVDGLDVSQLVLETARRGVYTANAFRSRDLTFRDRHFRLAPEGYALSAEVKSAVDFHEGNLLDPNLLAGQPRYDMIFCRNLLIYFDEPARHQALANLDRLLGPTGLLFVGHAEQLGLFRPLFRPLADRGTFAFERAPVGTPNDKPTRPAALPRQTLARVKRATAGPPATIPKHIALPPAVIEPLKPDLKPNLLEEAARLADLGQHEEAARFCEREIGRAGPSAPAFFLLGVIRQAAGNRDQAQRDFEKAVYLDPGHDEALLALSLLAQRRGDSTVAAAYRRRSERASQEKPLR